MTRPGSKPRIERNSKALAESAGEEKPGGEKNEGFIAKSPVANFSRSLPWKARKFA
jgi:hypothetical protein